MTRIPSRGQRVQEDFPIVELLRQTYRLYSKKMDLGVEVSWNREAFHFLWYWLNWGTLDHPWFGRARTLALEPTTTPNGNGLREQIRDGTAVVLQPKSRLHGEIRMKLFQGAL